MRELQAFNYQGNEIRAIQHGGETWWVLKDVCEALGLRNPTQVAQRLDDDERAMFDIGRQGESNIVNESGLYNVILRSDKPEAKSFKRWITHDVLPAIRKHGLYAMDELLDNPDIAIAALQRLKEERLRNKALETENAQKTQVIAEMQPKVSYYDLILQSKQTVPLTLIAKDYGMSAKTMNKILHELGVQYSMCGTWLLYQKHAEQGYTQSRTHVIDAERTRMHTYWTQKGRLFLYELLKRERAILPIIERQEGEGNGLD